MRQPQIRQGLPASQSYGVRPGKVPAASVSHSLRRAASRASALPEISELSWIALEDVRSNGDPIPKLKSSRAKLEPPEKLADSARNPIQDNAPTVTS